MLRQRTEWGHLFVDIFQQSFSLLVHFEFMSVSPRSMFNAVPRNFFPGRSGCCCGECIIILMISSTMCSVLLSPGQHWIGLCLQEAVPTAGAGAASKLSLSGSAGTHRTNSSFLRL